MYIFLEVIVDTISINEDVTEEDGLFVIFAMITSKSQRKRPRKDFSFIPDIVRLTVIGRISDVSIVFEIIICTLHTTLNLVSPYVLSRLIITYQSLLLLMLWVSVTQALLLF